ncbi:MAG: ABC transporter substrate-binding protein [Ilumatobacter sp.]|nr:ABC transporter substrate-binding protein [Ilumatobacter sp.]
MLRRLLGAGLLVGTLTLGTLAAPAAAQDDTTMIVGLTQPWETLNPVVGFAVSEYEIWNIQYTGLTTLAADDYAPEPGLAESWVEDEPGVSYTYTLREGLMWSDGEPITAEDVAWNINTSRDQEWSNYISTVANLSAEVVDDRTVTVTSEVPDPRLPAVGIYILPKHIWEEQATPETIDSYDGLDGVGSGPFTISDYQSEESLTMTANPNYYDGQPAVDTLIFRYFANPDAMVAAIQRGEIDAAQGIPASSFETLDADPDIVAVAGLQGGFDEIAFNGGAAEGQPHPALLDLGFRQALNMAIDKEGAAEDLWFGLAEPATAVSMAADLAWVPEIPTEEQLTYDPEAAAALLDELGYVDTDGNGFREMPGGGDDIVLRHAVNTDSDLGGAVGELWSNWMNAIGIQVELEAYDQDQLYGVIVDGTYDTFYWGWVPFVDPDPMLSYFTEAELGNWNDANWFDPEFDALYTEQNQEIDPARRQEIVHEMVRILYDAAVYPALWYTPDLQAYRTDRFEGFVRQPAEVGPVIFSQSSPSYALLQPIGSGETPAETTPDGTTAPDETAAPGDTSAPDETTAPGDGESDDDGGGNATTIVIIVVVLAVLGAGAFLIAKRRGSADERE